MVRKEISDTACRWAKCKSRDICLKWRNLNYPSVAQNKAFCIINKLIQVIVLGGLWLGKISSACRIERVQPEPYHKH